MAVVKNLMVRAGADFSAITKQASKASQSMRGMQSSVSRSCNLMTKAASGVNKVLGALGIGLSAAAIVSFGKEAAEAYDSQVKNEMRLAGVMRNTMGASNAEIQSIMDLTAAEQQLGVVGDEAQMAGAQQLATYLHLSSSLKTLLPIMNDLAVQQYGFNVSEDQAVSIAKLFGKAMEGQTGALTRYGFSVTDAQARVLKYGSEQERAATLANIVSQKVGGMNAALASTPTGRMQQLKNSLGDIKEQFGQAVRTIGTVFLPFLNAVGSALAGIATMANKVAQTIANVFGGTAAGKEWQWSGVSAGISDTADAYDDLTDAQNGSARAAKRLQTASFDTLNILRATSATGTIGYGGSSGSGGGSNPISETGTAAEEAGENIGWLQEKLEKLKSGWEDFKKKLDFSGLKRSWGELKEAIGQFASAVGEILGPVWEKVLKPLGVWTINKALPFELKTIAAQIEYIAKAINNLKTVYDRIKEAVKPSLDKLGISLKDFKNAFDELGGSIKELWAALSEALGPVLKPILNWLVKFTSFKLSAQLKAIASVIDSLTKKIKLLSQVISKIAETINKIKNGNGSSFLKAFSITLPMLPISWHAKGGVFDQASLIGVGENGKEAVVPLERNTGWISRVATELAAQMVGSAGLLGGEALIEGIHDAVYEAMMAVMGTQARGNSHKTVMNINGREFFRAIWDDYKAVARERGVSLVNT